MGEPVKQTRNKPQMVNGKEDLSGILSSTSSVPSSVILRKETTLNNNMNGIVTPNSTISTQEHALYQVLQPSDHTVRGKFGSSTVYKMPSGKENDKNDEPPNKKQRHR